MWIGHQANPQYSLKCENIMIKQEKSPQLTDTCVDKLRKVTPSSKDMSLHQMVEQVVHKACFLIKNHVPSSKSAHSSPNVTSSRPCHHLGYHVNFSGQRPNSNGQCPRC